MEQRLALDMSLLRRYDVSGPRYTSYPTALQFSPAVGVDSYLGAVAAGNEDFVPRPLSLYVHIPFCRKVCFYCGCNKVITANYRRAESYLARLQAEIQRQGRLFAGDRGLQQLHFGGGTPTYLKDDDLVSLLGSINAAFSAVKGPQREFSIEIDPRTTDAGRMRLLSQLGFNRMSLGVQDFDPEVQKAVNREQSVEQTREVIDAGREAGFRSTNLDLIYGLPLQSVDSFAATLETVLEMRPERLAVYNYAHMPHLFKVQRQIRASDLPGPEQKLAILEMTIRRLLDAGYVYIGMDHFALPDDELARAQREGGLHRNFQGYSTRAECDLIGVGASAISKIGDAYFQNHKDLDDYQAAIDAGGFAVTRGAVLSAEDVLRRDVIMALMCHSQVRFGDIERRHKVVFRQYFAGELERLKGFIEDGLLEIRADGIYVTPRGRLLLRNIGMVFDAYAAPDRARQGRFSKVI
ncbi:oxygen-independent coproporphyrinogen III oxidase [Ectothiorhodospiraceae bacterium WFHF3C12]|nr:oxygen-independent coproporphyrinogen III oxidase [Ectothiorhodospiraceae bacterium WFHF3C12]